MQVAVQRVVREEVFGEHPSTPRRLPKPEILMQPRVVAEIPMRRLEQFSLAQRRGDSAGRVTSTSKERRVISGAK